MEESQYLAKARARLQEVRGKKLTVDERRESAIELTKWMINEARRTQTRAEHTQQTELAGMMEDSYGKVFSTSVTDQCFRSHRPERAASQLLYLIHKYGIPSFLPWWKKFSLAVFTYLGQSLSKITIPLFRRALRRETSNVIIAGEPRKLQRHLTRRKREGIRSNVNHLGEAVLGEEEAKTRLHIYLNDLADPHVEYISIKISTIFSQVNLLSWDDTLEVLAGRLRQLYQAAMRNEFVYRDGKKSHKFVNLDMEEYRDLHMTVALFRKVLDEPEFFHCSAGIVLQSYLPDSYLIQQELTLWAMQRVAAGGAPVKIRIVKGANLSMEQLESSLQGWAQAPYTNKSDVDANFKRMITYACQPEHASAVHIGVGSHNLFDIAYAMLLCKENCIEEMVCFEMLEGMADHIRRVVQKLTKDVLLYCPAATDQEFHNAVAYLVRRLDENTAPDNFLRHIFNLIPGTKDWQKQSSLFSLACHAFDATSFKVRRTQNRLIEPKMGELSSPFQNEPDTDWSLPSNRRWAQEICKQWQERSYETIPLVIEGNAYVKSEKESREDPSRPGKILFDYSLADAQDAEKALAAAKKAEPEWAATNIKERSALLAKVAHQLRRRRADLIGAMMADTGKIIPEGDSEVSEAIDFAEYYRRSVETFSELNGLRWSSKGTVLVAPPWNFPCSIPAGGILAALAVGNCVIFKPARQATLTGYELAKAFWDAGVSRHVLQFIACKGDPIGSQLVSDPRINVVIMTGGTDTAKHLLALRNGAELMAETGGKNAIIVTAMADRDLAVKSIVYSAFRHGGQKCSACSLLILEVEVYEDPQFWKQLVDATISLVVGSAWDLKTFVNPLISPPGAKLMRGLTVLEEGEEWVVQPKAHPDNAYLWSPGIKKGVKMGSFTHQTELFGPVLAVMRAENLDHAIQLANGTPYGLTAGLHSLDEREHKVWLKKIRAGNCYINRGITGAIVRRQPFGGCKASAFGPGVKAGGPNYVIPLMKVEEIGLPIDVDTMPPSVAALSHHIEEQFTADVLKLWRTSIKSYAYQWKHYFSQSHDPSKVKGQDNFLRYVPRSKVLLRVQEKDREIDYLRVIAACLTCGTPLEVSSGPGKLLFYNQLSLPHVSFFEESEEQMNERIVKERIKRIRLLSQPQEKLRRFLIESACDVVLETVLAHGRLELLHYVREVSISIDYHRYGNLGIREKEKRAPLPKHEGD